MIPEFTTHFIPILEHSSKQQQTSIPTVLPRPFTLFHHEQKKWEGCLTRVFEGLWLTRARFLPGRNLLPNDLFQVKEVSFIILGTCLTIQAMFVQ